jgi:hypothetical protein
MGCFNSLWQDLIFLSGLPHRGRRREYAIRDRLIYQLHRSGLSYGAIAKLIQDWSPEQVSGWLKIRYPDDERMRVSHE